MADLSDIQAAQTVKLVGSNSTGVEQTPVQSSTLGELSVNDTPDQAGVDGTITLTTTAIAAKIGSLPLDGRKYVVLQATTNNVKWGFTSSCLYDCFKNQLIFIPAGPNCPIYLKSSSGSATVLLGEE